MGTRRIAAPTDPATVAGAASDGGDRHDAPEPDTRAREARVAGYDVVDDSGDASFPASDPPSWWGGA